MEEQGSRATEQDEGRKSDRNGSRRTATERARERKREEEDAARGRRSTARELPLKIRWKKGAV